MKKSNITRGQFLGRTAALTALTVTGAWGRPAGNPPAAKSGSTKLSQIPEGEAYFNLLIGGLAADDPVVAADAARLLGELGDRNALGPLCEYARFSRYNYKTAGLDALARLGSAEAIPTLRTLVDEPNVNDDWYWTSHASVRAAAAVALLALDDDGGIPFLETLAEEQSNVFYARFSPEILRLARVHPVAETLVDRITVEALFSLPDTSIRMNDPGLVLYVVEALGLIGGEEALKKVEGFLDWRSRYVRGQAAKSLLAADPDRLDRVVGCLRREPTHFARLTMALALAEAGDDSHLGVLVTAAEKDKDPFDRATALTAMGQLGRGECRESVVAALSHPDHYLRMCAVQAAPLVGIPLETIESFLGDSNPRVRLQAAGSLLCAFGRQGRFEGRKPSDA